MLVAVSGASTALAAAVVHAVPPPVDGALVEVDAVLELADGALELVVELGTFFADVPELLDEQPAITTIGSTTIARRKQRDGLMSADSSDGTVWRFIDPCGPHLMIVQGCVTVRPSVFSTIVGLLIGKARGGAAVAQAMTSLEPS